MKYVTFCCLIFCLPLFGFGQISLEGIILSNDGLPISYAEVRLLQDSLPQAQSLTDESGAFQLRATPGQYTLSARHFGKEILQMPINLQTDTKLDTLRVDASVYLDEVVLKGRASVIEQKYDKLVFRVENSPLKEGYDGLEVIRRSPKLRINSSGDILLRNAPVQVLVNGRRLNLSGEEIASYLSSINSETIQQIEIQDTGSADTDAANTGGVINIILKKIPKGWRLNLRSSYTYLDADHDGWYTGIAQNFGSDKWNIYARADYRKTEDFGLARSTLFFDESIGRNENESTSDYRQNVANATGGFVFYPNDKHQIGAEVYFSQTDMSNLLNEDLQIFRPELSAVGTNLSGTESKTNLWYTTFNYRYQIDSLGSSFKVIADIGKNDFNNENDIQTAYSFGSLIDQRNLYASAAASDYYTLQTDWKQVLKAGWEMDMGAKVSSIRRENQLDIFFWEQDLWHSQPAGEEDFDNQESIWAAYVSTAGRIKEKHQLKVGLRAEFTQIDGINNLNQETVGQEYFNLFPNLYYGYQVAEGKTLSFSYGRRIRRPSFRDLNPFVFKQNDFLFQVGNPRLQPQYTNKFDVSFQMPQQSISAYGSMTRDVITGIYQVDSNNVSFYQPNNFGTQKEAGIDYAYYGSVNKWLYLSASAGLYYYTFTFEDLNPGQLAHYATLYAKIQAKKGFS
ncbi:MAG: TonB-dependent receptor, partial [Bacteroidota bacterium]